MPERQKIVELMLTAIRQIAESDRFASDARQYAEIAQDFRDHEAAASLRAMAVVRETDILLMRAIMGELATKLARIPIEAG